MSIRPLVESAPEADAPRAPLRHGMREEQFFLLVAIIIGVFSGLAVVCFRIAIDWARFLLLTSALTPPFPRIVLAPALVGVLVAVLVMVFFQRVRGSGVNQTKGALYIYDGYIPFKTVIGKFITSALAIGSGHSLGPEDPSLQIGAGLASLIGRKFRLSRDKMRLIAPVGAAAGLAAAFNAPITAVLFVIEEVIGRWTAGVLGAVVLSAVSSVVVARWFLGAEPLFRIPTYSMVHPGELLAYAVLGVAGGFAGVVFQKLIGHLRPALKALPRWTQYLQPGVAGLLIGLIALRLPQVQGAGYEYIDQAMHGQYLWETLGILAGAKILATTLSFTSGTPGGLFAPTLFIGAMLGGAVGEFERLMFPHLAVPIGAYALVGMGTLFAGFLRAPMTSVFMILEVSGDYSIIIPVIISNTIAYLISRALQQKPIFEVLSDQDGMHLPSLEEEREVSVVRVEDAMRPPSMAPLHEDTPLSVAAKLAEDSHEDFILVSSTARNWYGISRERLRTFLKEGKGDLSLSAVMPLRPMPYVHPDQSLDLALREIGDHPLLPVVHRADLKQLVGVISLADIMTAYHAGGRPLT